MISHSSDKIHIIQHFPLCILNCVKMQQVIEPVIAQFIHAVYFDSQNIFSFMHVCLVRILHQIACPSFPLNCLAPLILIMLFLPFMIINCPICLHLSGHNHSCRLCPYFYLRLRLFQSLPSFCLYLCAAVVVPYGIHAQ